MTEVGNKCWEKKELQLFVISGGCNYIFFSVSFALFHTAFTSMCSVHLLVQSYGGFYALYNAAHIDCHLHNVCLPFRCGTRTNMGAHPVHGLPQQAPHHQPIPEKTPVLVGWLEGYPGQQKAVRRHLTAPPPITTRVQYHHCTYERWGVARDTSSGVECISETLTGKILRGEWSAKLLLL